MTSRQQPLSATAGNNFAAVTMIFMRHSLSIAASHYFAAAIATASQVSLRTLAMGLAICGYHRHTNSVGRSGNFRDIEHLNMALQHDLWGYDQHAGPQERVA